MNANSVLNYSILSNIYDSDGKIEKLKLNWHPHNLGFLSLVKTIHYVNIQLAISIPGVDWKFMN